MLFRWSPSSTVTLNGFFPHSPFSGTPFLFPPPSLYFCLIPTRPPPFIIRSLTFFPLIGLSRRTTSLRFDWVPLVDCAIISFFDRLIVPAPFFDSAMLPPTPHFLFSPPQRGSPVLVLSRLECFSFLTKPSTSDRGSPLVFYVRTLLPLSIPCFRFFVPPHYVPHSATMLSGFFCVPFLSHL